MRFLLAFTILLQLVFCPAVPNELVNEGHDVFSTRCPFISCFNQPPKRRFAVKSASFRALRLHGLHELHREPL